MLPIPPKKVIITSKISNLIPKSNFEGVFSESTAGITLGS